MSRKHITSILTDAAEHYFMYKLYSVHREFGVGRKGTFRLDLLCMNMKSDFVGIEVKSCKQDYTTDTKYLEYLKYVNRLYFMLPPKLIRSTFYDQILSDIKSHGIGIMSLDPSGKVYVVKPAKRKPVDDCISQQSILKMAWRSGLTCRDVPRRKRKFKLD